MAINFPDTKNVNDIFTDGGKSWIWDGTTWKIYSSSTSGIGLGDLSVNTSSVGTAALSYNQSTGVFTYTPPDLSSYITQQYTLPTASTTVLGGVKVDGSSINIDANGVISGASTYTLPTASTTVLGGVKVDGTTITINNGIISGASSVPTSITVATESTDTTCFPLFTTDATGNLAPKTVNSFKLNSSSGQIEAGSFKKTGGSSSEFLKADGSIDSTTYLSSNPSYTLNDLSNVDATTNLANGKILKYDLSTTSWVVADDGGGAGSGGGNVAVGSVMMWSGSVASIPTGWQLCDGTNGSPDLRDKFVIGAGNNYSVGATGGSATDTVNISGSDTVTITGSDTVNITISGTTGGATEGGGGYPSSGYNAHRHSFSGSGSDTVTITGSDTVNISGSDTVNTIPPYYALCYIYCTATGSNQTFIGLDDTPISHSNGKYLQSNGSALIWVDPPSGFSGNYNDLSNKPTLFSGSYNDLSNKPNLFDGTWSSLSGKPTLFSGSYTDLTNKPTLFDGTWSSLSGKPTIPSTLNDLTDVDATTGAAVGKILKYNGSSWELADDATGGGVSQIQSDWNQSNSGSVDFIKNKPTLFSGSYNDLSNKPTLFSGSYNDLSNKPTIFSGSWNDLSDKPTLVTQLSQLSDVNFSGSPANDSILKWSSSTGQWVVGTQSSGFSGNYNDLSNKPTLFSGSYNDLSNKPTLFSGSWNDLSNKPTLFSGSYNDLSNKPNLFDGTWSSLSGKPTLFSGSYTDLTNKPTLFDGTWSSLSGKPTIPSTLNDLTDVDATTGAAVGKILKYNGSSWELADDATGGGVSQIQSDWNQSNSGSVDFIKNKPTLFSGSYNDLSNKPTLFSGSYNDLSNKPTIFSGSWNDLSDKPTIFSGSWNDLSDKPTLVTQLSQLTDVTFSGSPANDSILKWSSSTGKWVVGTQSGGFSGNYNDLTNKPNLFSGSYNDLSNKPTLFDGTWSSLSGKPTIPTNNNQLTNGAGYITSAPDADKIIEGNTRAEVVDGGSGYFKVEIDGTERFRVQNNGETILKRTNTSLEGGHLQFEDSDGVQSFAIDVYGTTTSNSRLRFIDQVTNTQRFTINRSGAFGVGAVNAEDYGSSGEVLISQGSSSQPIWGSVSSTVPVVESVIRTSDVSTTSESYQTAHVLTVNPNVSSSSLLIVAAGMMGSWREDDYDDPEKNRCEAVLYRGGSIIGTSCVSSLADHSGPSNYTNTGFNLTVKDTNNHGGNNVTYYLKFRRYGTNDNGPVKIMKGTSLTVQELI